MAAPTKKYLSYYNWECNSYDVDCKLQDLSFEFGPLGETVYRRVLDLIYSNGHYIEMPIEKLARVLVQKIGSQWLKTNKCVEILTYCVEIGLFDSNLVQSNIWTSSGIQNRYFGIMKQLKRVIDPKNEKYLLIDILLNAPVIVINSEESDVNSEESEVNLEESEVNSAKNKAKQIKSNETKVEEKKIKDLLLESLIQQIEFKYESKVMENDFKTISDLYDEVDFNLLKFIAITDFKINSTNEFIERVQYIAKKGIRTIDEYIEREDNI